VMISNVLGLSTGVAMLLSFQSIAYQLTDPKPAGYGFDIFTTGLYLLPMAIVMLLVTYPVGILISKIGVKPFLFAGTLVGIFGFYLMSTATTAIQIPEYLSVVSLGLAMLFVSMQNLLVLTVKPMEMGNATSMNAVFRNIGQSLGAPIAGSILSTFTISVVFFGQTLAVPTKEAFQYTYYVAAIFFVASLLIVLFAREVIGRNAKKVEIEQVS
jgi:MFS family permease